MAKKKLPKYLTPAALGFRNVKAKTTPEFYSWLLHLNPSQQSLVKEILFQLSGRKPSRLYAQYRFADPLPSDKARDRARKMAHLEHQHMSRAVARDKLVGNGLGKIVKTLASHVAKAAKQARTTDMSGIGASS